MVEERIYVLETGKDIKSITHEIKLFDRRNSELKLEVSKLSSRERIKAIVSETKGLTIPNLNQIAIIEVEREESDIQSSMDFAKALGKLKKSWDRITFSSRERKTNDI
ncbi:hypothetical protein JXI42_01270 [bacterium]|nr:hypothetical protein [bacterium]